MENGLNLPNAALYLLKKVQVTFQDHSTVTGTLQSYGGEIVQLDGTSFPTASVSDIEYVANIDDYHTFLGFGEIGNIRFSTEDLHPDFPSESLMYGELVCTVSCHLYLKDEGICAKDIRLLEKRHTINYACAREKTLIYSFDDGSTVLGRITGTAPDFRILSQDGQELPVEPEHIADITKAPETNDYVYVRMSAESAEYCGLVSAVSGTKFAIIDSNGLPMLLDLCDVAMLRYRGTVRRKKVYLDGKQTTKIMILTGASLDTEYLCKPPYARDREAIAGVQDGDTVSFIPGLNDRYFIAKDVDILQSEAMEEAAPECEKEYYGVIVTVDFKSPNGYGYVGNRYVSKACPKSVDRVLGRARFTRNQLDFTIEYNKAFIVKYTATENPETGLRVIRALSLHQVLDSLQLGIIDVADDGTVSTVPLHQVLIFQYENRDVDVLCGDGSVVSGKLQRHSDTEIFLSNAQENSNGATVIPFADIREIRIIGTVSDYDSINGTGRIDNTFFFHINGMERSIDKRDVHEGIQVSFCLVNSRKGNFIDCGRIRILKGETRNVYVLAYHDQTYTVVDADKYGKRIRFLDDAYTVPFSRFNQFRNLENEDYHAFLTIQGRNGRSECTGVRALEASPKLRQGIVTELNRKANTVSIVSPANYRKNPLATSYALSVKGQAWRMEDTARKDYQVLYYTRTLDGVPTATITWVDTKETFDKCFFGYLEQFYQNKGYGWITPEELFKTPRNARPNNFGIYCRKDAIVQNEKAESLYSPNWVLQVCYTLDFESRITPQSPKKPAKQVWILGKIDRAQEGRTPESAPAPGRPPVQTPATVKKHTEILTIGELAAPPALAGEAGKAYEYGLINFFSSHNALINEQYYNRSYAPQSDYVYDQSKTVVFNPEETTVTPDPRLKTGKYAYLVRYVRKGTVTNPTTGKEQPTVDPAIPIEVIHAFPKKQCASVVLDGETVTVEYVEVSQPEPQAQFSPTEDNDDAPELMIGESLYLKLRDDSALHGIYSGESEEAYYLSNGKTIGKSEISRLFRFGIITALSIENGTATINNLFDFSLKVAEPPMLSILKNQKNTVRLHVMYSCAEGKITEVCRVSKRCLSCLVWESGVVTELDSAAHSIIIDSSIRHYLTVMSDGINPYVNNRTCLNRAVYIKQVFHPYLGSNEVEPGIVASAVDVRCREEELRIQYDEGTDVYLGYRNASVSFPVKGSTRLLQDSIDAKVTVLFRVGQDQHSLEGYIDEDDETPEEKNETADDLGASLVREEALSQLLLHREDADQTVVRFHLNAASDQDQVQRAVESLINDSRPLTAIRIAMEYPGFEVLRNQESLLKTEIQKRSTAVGLDANACSGEQAYYYVTALRYPAAVRNGNRWARIKEKQMYQNLYLCRLFSQDFDGPEENPQYLQNEYPAKKAKAMLANLFRKPCRQIGELVAHIVLLDKRSLSIVCGLIEENPPLSAGIVSFAKEVDETIPDERVTGLLCKLQEHYQNDKRRFSNKIFPLIGRDDVCEELKKLLPPMQVRFLKLICGDDRRRFESLLEICTDVLDYTSLAGFTRQEQQLQYAYREIGQLIESIQAHPCKESLEILLSAGCFDASNNILMSIRKNIFALLNNLYSNASIPRIEVRVNENSIPPESHTLWLIIENGSPNENLQTAENLRIELQSFTLGFELQQRVRLAQNRLPCGEQFAVEVEFALIGETADVLEFGWTAEYEYTTQFQSNGDVIRSSCRQVSEHPLQLQIDSASAEQKNIGAGNPYLDPARGQPLIGKEMFFGRKAEKREILNLICTKTEEKGFRPGSAVIIHGQKKSGKTSLVNQIKNEIAEDPELREKAITLNFSNILDETGGVELLPCFKRTFYAVIMSRLKDEIIENHRDVMEKMKEIGLEVPDLLSPQSEAIWPGLFDHFFQDFSRMDGGTHSVILYMDEFTLLCTTILSEIQHSPENASLKNIPNFIKTFSQYGFIQIIIGHEAMMRALNTLGVLNHTAEFAKAIEISALDEAASRELVTKPMEKTFGYDVYNSELGKQAVDRLLDLSGRNPAYLMRLCSKLFMYYTDPQKCLRTQLLVSDVDAMVQEYTGELLLSDFDILLMEDGDDAVEAEKRNTYHYLKCAALLSLASYDKRTADSSEITRKLVREYGYSESEIEKTRNILEARRVISITMGARVKINTGLFSAFIQQKNGLR